jgi:uncharacterized protein YggU (UPF0235/DUF167 family)
VPPQEGKANQALLHLLAKALGLPVSRLTMEAGHTARIKTVGIEGEPEVLAALLDTTLRKDRP